MSCEECADGQLNVRVTNPEDIRPRVHQEIRQPNCSSVVINPLETDPRNFQILQLDPLRVRAEIYINRPAPSTGYQVSGNVTNPGATTNIATFGVTIPPGSYMVNWQVGLQGTVTAADANNMQLFAGGNSLSTAQYPGQVGNFPMEQEEVVLPQGYSSANGIKVRTIGAASGVSAIYTAQISAVPVDQGQQLVALCHSLSQAEEVIQGVQSGLYTQGINIPQSGTVVQCGERIPYRGQGPLWAVPLGLQTIVGILAERKDR